MFTPYEVILEVHIGKEIANRQKIQAPKEMLIANFLQLTKEVEQNKSPMKIKMIRSEIIWDEFEKKQKTINNEIEYKNIAMISFEEDINNSE